MAIVDMGVEANRQNDGAHRFLGGLAAFSQSCIASAQGSCYDKMNK